MSCPAHARASKVESFTIGCMIRGYHAHLQGCFGQVTIRDVLYCHHDEVSAEGPLGSGTAAKYKCPLSWEVCTCKET